MDLLSRGTGMCPQIVLEKDKLSLLDTLMTSGLLRSVSSKRTLQGTRHGGMFDNLFLEHHPRRCQIAHRIIRPEAPGL